MLPFLHRNAAIRIHYLTAWLRARRCYPTLSSMSVQRVIQTPSQEPCHARADVGRAWWRRRHQSGTVGTCSYIVAWASSANVRSRWRTMPRQDRRQTATPRSRPTLTPLAHSEYPMTCCCTRRSLGRSSPSTLVETATLVIAASYPCRERRCRHSHSPSPRCVSAPRGCMRSRHPTWPADAPRWVTTAGGHRQSAPSAPSAACFPSLFGATNGGQRGQ